MIDRLQSSRRVLLRRIAAACGAGTLVALSAFAPFGRDPLRTPNVSANDSSDVAATVIAYHSAIAAGDSAKGLALLAPDAVIVESGGIETREEFRAPSPSRYGVRASREERARAYPSDRARRRRLGEFDKYKPGRVSRSLHKLLQRRTSGSVTRR